MRRTFFSGINEPKNTPNTVDYVVQESDWTHGATGVVTWNHGRTSAMPDYVCVYMKATEAHYWFTSGSIYIHPGTYGAGLAIWQQPANGKIFIRSDSGGWIPDASGNLLAFVPTNFQYKIVALWAS